MSAVWPVFPGAWMTSLAPHLSVWVVWSMLRGCLLTWRDVICPRCRLLQGVTQAKAEAYVDPSEEGDFVIRLRLSTPPTYDLCFVRQSSVHHRMIVNDTDGVHLRKSRNFFEDIEGLVQFYADDKRSELGVQLQMREEYTAYQNRVAAAAARKRRSTAYEEMMPVSRDSTLKEAFALFGPNALSGKLSGECTSFSVL